MNQLAQTPSFTLSDAESISAQHFGISGTASLLDSERDCNFKIESDDLTFVLKIANPATDPRLLELENAAIQIASGCRYFRCPKLIKTLANSPMVSVRDGDRQDCQVRMISFLEGSTLAQTPDPPNSTWVQLGQALGELDLALEHLNQNHLARRMFQWDLTQAAGIIEEALAAGLDEQPARVNGLPAVETRETILNHFRRVYRNVETRLARVPRSVIHNDANDYNILLSSDIDSPLIGLIDFGDMVYSHQINELAIAAAYVALQPAEEDSGWTDRLVQLAEGYHRLRPLSEDELSVLFPLAAMRLCQSVCLANQQRKIRPDDQYLSVSEKPAWNALTLMMTFDPGELHTRLSQACRQANAPIHLDEYAEPSTDLKQLKRRRAKSIAPSLSLSYSQPLHIVRGQGQYLFDAQDVTYLDCVNNVCHVGHCHPRVVAAAESQMRCLNTNTRYLHENLVRYAERLASKLPDPLEVCFFVNSGSEANDLALRLARVVSGQHDAVVIDHAYHGHTSALIELSPYKFNGRGGQGQSEHVHVLDMPDLYRGRYQTGVDGDETTCSQLYVADAIATIDQAVRADHIPAAFFAESLLGCGGQIPLPAGYLAPIYEAIRNVGGVCIADEVQVGFGRVGDKFWGFQKQGVIPDIVTMGKPIGNGHPLAAVVTTRRIADAFNNGMEYFNTFGGNPVSCAIGMAVLDVIEEEHLQSHAASTGGRLHRRLERLQQEFDVIGDVRGSGLFLGIEIVRPGGDKQPNAELAAELVESMKRQRILLSTDGPMHNVIKFKPPLVFSDGDADRLAITLEQELRRR